MTVAGIVADESVGGAEVVIHQADAARLGIDDERFVLVTDSDRDAVLQTIRDRTPAGEHLSLRSSAEARWLRHGDRVEPQAIVKRVFGEFTFRDTGGRDIQIDPAWTAANIVRESVPILGTITCHRSIVPAVRAAMTELEQSGKANTVDPSSYAGCHYARRIAPARDSPATRGASHSISTSARTRAAPTTARIRRSCGRCAAGASRGAASRSPPIPATTSSSPPPTDPWSD